jgi:hypothetical protein
MRRECPGRSRQLEFESAGVERNCSRMACLTGDDHKGSERTRSMVVLGPGVLGVVDEGVHDDV